MAAVPMTMNSSLTSSIGCGKRCPASSTSGICTRTLRATPGSPGRITRRCGGRSSERTTRCTPRSTSRASSCPCVEQASRALPSGQNIFQNRTLAVRKWSWNMFMPVFTRNPKEHAVFSSLDIVAVGGGSIGGTLIDILARTGVGSLTLIDPEDFAEENVGRHVLTGDSVGKSKVEELARHVARINPDCRVTALKERFDASLLSSRPDLVVSTADSFQAASLVNSYALREKIPAIFGGVWGEASVAEILYVLPGKTPCYECYGAFRRNVEIPQDTRRYTDPNYDETRIPGQAGLWANILMVAGLQFQVILGLVGLRDTLKYSGTVWLMNISDPNCPFQPLALTVGEVKKGCAVCDQGCLEELLRENLADNKGATDPSMFNPGEKMVDDNEESRKSLAEMARRGIFI